MALPRAKDVIAYRSVAALAAEIDLPPEKQKPFYTPRWYSGIGWLIVALEILAVTCAYIPAG